MKLYNAFQALDAQVRDGRPYLMGDEFTIADVFWSMKILRLIETGYPIAAYHPALYQWYERMYARSAFQNEVMGKNRVMNGFFRAKSRVENALGMGLNQAFAKVLAA